MNARAQVLVCEIVDCGLLGEGVIPTLVHARDHLLVDQPTLIPCGAQVSDLFLLLSALVRHFLRWHGPALFSVHTTPFCFQDSLTAFFDLSHPLVLCSPGLCAGDQLSAPASSSLSPAPPGQTPSDRQNSKCIVVDPEAT